MARAPAGQAEGDQRWFPEDEDDVFDESSDEEARPDESFLNYLLDLQRKGKIHANDVCILCHHAQAAGARGERLAKAAMPPGKASGNYSRHLMNALQLTFPVELYTLKCPGNDKRKVGRVTVELPLLPVHELVALDLASAVGAQAMLEQTRWPPAYYQHPVVKAHPGVASVPAGTVHGRRARHEERRDAGDDSAESGDRDNLACGSHQEVPLLPLRLQRLVYTMGCDALGQVVF